MRIGKALNMDALVRKFEATSTKDVYFCLDNSGSMAGGLNRACVEQLTDIVTNFINDDDRAGLMLFSSRLEVRTLYTMQWRPHDTTRHAHALAVA